MPTPREGRRKAPKAAARPTKAPATNGTGGHPNGGARPPVDKIMSAKVATLIPYAKNPRLHSPEQVGQIAASMREFGQTQLVVVDDRGEIIAGHGRVLAAEQLGWTHVTVGVAVGWTGEQKRGYRIADNQLGLTSSWDRALLRSEVGDLKLDGGDLDLALLGFGAGDLESLLAEAQAPDEFAEFGEDIETEHQCPKCGYRWSGGA